MHETSDVARLLSLLRQFPYPRLALELGCGDCPGLVVLSPAPHGVLSMIIGLDRDGLSLGRARLQSSTSHPVPSDLHLLQADLHLVQADAAHLPFRCKFDLILIRHPDIDQSRLRWKPVIQRAIGWLAEPGILLITTYGVSEIEGARRWLVEIGIAPMPLDERRLVPAGLDGRDRFVLAYRKPPDARLSAAV